MSALSYGGLDRQTRFQWKYDFIRHIQTFHLNNNDTLPPFPGELRVTTRIRSEEEKKIGIRQEQTDLCPEDNDVPDSMSILELMQDQEIAQQEEGREGRRRAASNISSISAGRQPSPTKRLQT